jgi:hypothetical protein
MKRPVTVRLGSFVSKALAAEAMNGGQPSSASVERAIHCYLGDRDSAGPGWSFPAFLRGREPVEPIELRLEIDDELWRSLEEEAGRQGVSVQQMLEHAMLYFAAEVNAGRVTERILDDLGEKT